jgi:hypothetical protein
VERGAGVPVFPYMPGVEHAAVTVRPNMAAKAE